MLISVGGAMMGVGYLMGEYSVEIRWWVANETAPVIDDTQFTLVDPRVAG